MAIDIDPGLIHIHNVTWLQFVLLRGIWFCKIAVYDEAVTKFFRCM